MSITAIEVDRLEVPMHQSYGSAHHPDFATMTSTMVTVRGDGVEGIGTADATPGYSLQTHPEIMTSLTEVLGPAVLAAAPTTPNALLAVLAEHPGMPNAKCALEVAFLDWYGRRTDTAIVDLLGGAQMDRVPLNGWVGIDAPDAMAAAAREWLDGGYASIKIKLAGDPAADIDRVAAVYDAVGDAGMAIRADVNQGYGRAEADTVAQALEEYPIVHLEQPIVKTDWEGLAALTASTSTPIMADEIIETPTDAFRILAGEVADRIKVKILRMGGVLGTRRVLEAAALADRTVVVGHGFGLTPATAAEVALCATHPAVFGAVEAVGPLKMAEQPFTDLQIADGAVAVPTTPGLGVEVDPDALAAMRVAHESLS